MSSLNVPRKVQSRSQFDLPAHSRNSISIEVLLDALAVDYCVHICFIQKV